MCSILNVEKGVVLKDNFLGLIMTSNALHFTDKDMLTHRKLFFTEFFVWVLSVVSIGLILTFKVIFTPLEYIPTTLPLSSYVINICFVLSNEERFKSKNNTNGDYSVFCSKRGRCTPIWQFVNYFQSERVETTFSDKQKPCLSCQFSYNRLKMKLIYCRFC